MVQSGWLHGGGGSSSAPYTLGRSLSASWRKSQMHNSQSRDYVTGFHGGSNNSTILGLTPSCPLASCRLTACSSCCSSLTVWFRPAVIFSFLSISSCEVTDWKFLRTQCQHHVTTNKTCRQELNLPQLQVLTLCDVRLLFSISSSLSVTFESSPWIRSRDCWAWINKHKEL